MGQIIDGTAIAAQVKTDVACQVDQLLAQGGRAPHLVVILVGDDERSQVYVRQKAKACAAAHVMFTAETMKADVSRQQVLDIIREYDADDTVDGIIVQLPLPEPLAAHEHEIVNAISPGKDVDGLTDASLGRLYANRPGLVAATPAGILHMLRTIGCPVAGQHAVIIGRGPLVGRPLAMLLVDNDATVTVCHTKTRDLREVCRQADILVVAVGQQGLVDETYIKEGAVVIDVGINVGSDGHLHGDCLFDRMIGKASWMTPVPKGVGPMTVAMLVSNVLQAYRGHVS